MKVACLFEQSGTFKKVLIEKGHTAHDYDILNQYRETDYQRDLFKDIETGDISFINDYDLIIAFFPCTWFSVNNSFITEHYHNLKSGIKTELTNIFQNG